jgi:hypothetical protein
MDRQEIERFWADSEFRETLKDLESALQHAPNIGIEES